MKNRKFKYLFIILAFLTFSIQAKAVTMATLIGNEVSLRKGAGTNYQVIAKLKRQSSYELLDNNKYSGQGCSDGWYKINYNGTAGYVCSQYIKLSTTEANDSCRNEMIAAGFTDSSYYNDLCSLKSLHPSWTFKAVNTGLDWNTAVVSESSCGTSYIQSSEAQNIDTSCHNQYSESSGWKPASKSAVAYYMDPRNFFTERYIFQFEYLKYDQNLANAYVGGVTQIIKNSNFYSVHNDLPTVINQAGNATNVSPIFLASRMLQELGNGSSLYNLYSGVYPGSENYYNFFNYGVYDSCATTKGATACGLDYAKEKGWNSPYNAIVGAATALSKNYIAVGQYSNYLQKFNVVPNNASSRYTHQYMTNIKAPSSEASTAYNSYKDLGLVDLPFVFYIPVYNNMNQSIPNTGSGVTTPSTPSAPTNVAPGTVATSAGYRVVGSSISGVNPDSSVESIKANLESIGGSGSVTILNNQGQAVNSGLIGTGFTVNINTSAGNASYTVIIYGDASGDGKINSLDLLKVQKHILGSAKLSGAYLYAGSMDSNSTNVTALNLLKIQKHILGSARISQ